MNIFFDEIGNIYFSIDNKIWGIELIDDGIALIEEKLESLENIEVPDKLFTIKNNNLKNKIRKEIKEEQNQDSDEEQEESDNNNYFNEEDEIEIEQESENSDDEIYFDDDDNSFNFHFYNRDVKKKIRIKKIETEYEALYNTYIYGISKDTRGFSERIMIMCSVAKNKKSIYILKINIENENQPYISFKPIGEDEKKYNLLIRNNINDANVEEPSKITTGKYLELELIN